MHRARTAGINLGDSDVVVNTNIDAIKSVEVSRLENFHTEHPAMSLPDNIDVDGSDFVGPGPHTSVETGCLFDSHSSEQQIAESSWKVMTSRKKNSKKKLIFSNGSRFHME